MNMDLEAFLASLFNRLWIKEPGLDLYVRKAFYHLGDDRGVVRVLDLATINAAVRGAGAWTAFEKRLLVDGAFDLSPFVAVRIENVLNPRFAEKLLRDSWVPDGNGCFLWYLSK